MTFYFPIELGWLLPKHEEQFSGQCNATRLIHRRYSMDSQREYVGKSAEPIQQTDDVVRSGVNGQMTTQERGVKSTTRML
jgi:hypothetical protein